MNLSAEQGGFVCEFTQIPWGCDYYLQHGRMLDDDGIDRLMKYDAIYLGAIGDPRVADRLLDAPRRRLAPEQADRNADQAAGGNAAGGSAEAGSQPSGKGPCDIYEAGNTPCVAAHSTVRDASFTARGPLNAAAASLAFQLGCGSFILRYGALRMSQMALVMLAIAVSRRKSWDVASELIFRLMLR